jgi:ribonuclease P protein subunit RPR2
VSIIVNNINVEGIPKRMKRPHGRKSDSVKKASLDRISRLFELAEKNKLDPPLASRYVTLARKISARHKVKLPSNLKRRFCKNCGSYFIAGVSLRVRLRGGKTVYTCSGCSTHYRYPYSK